MKKLLCILCCLFAFVAQAEVTGYCTGPRSQRITILKKSLRACVLEISPNTPINKMIEIKTTQINCLQDVADKIFDAFYYKTKEERREEFLQYIEAIQEQNANLESGSDLGKQWHTSDNYALKQVNNTYFSIYEMVREYIKYLTHECEDYDDEFLEEMAKQYNDKEWL